MTYIQRIDHRPSAENLSSDEEARLARIFDAYGAEMVASGQTIRWEHLEAVEVVVAPHIGGVSGWFVKRVLMRGEERYHVGLYYGADEAVLPNISWDMARYVLHIIAFYAPQPVEYTGPEGLVDLTEI
ncbi:MAG: hypothetical protein EA396_01970 [Anaerolineaceae bacterium]|nr:MAG: hypothetical protein EA396_01970 [Anaerolineaceae bacterium]